MRTFDCKYCGQKFRSQEGLNEHGFQALHPQYKRPLLMAPPARKGWICQRCGDTAFEDEWEMHSHVVLCGAPNPTQEELDHAANELQKLARDLAEHGTDSG